MRVNNELIKKVSDSIQDGLANGYYPVENVLTETRSRAMPSAIRYFIQAGLDAIHMNSDIPGKSCYNIALS